MILVVVVVVVVIDGARRGDAARAEQRARPAIAQELEERERRRQLGRRNLVEQIARLPAQDLARRLARRDDARDLGRLGRLRDVAPRRLVRDLDPHVVEPGLDVEVQQLRPVREPALALRRERQQHVLEPPERALAVDRDQQPLAQRLVGHRRDEALHPAVLLARRRRIDTQVTLRVRRDPRPPRGGIGLTLDDREQVAVLEVEEALLIRRISLEGDLQITPVHRNRHRFALSPHPSSPEGSTATIMDRV